MVLNKMHTFQQHKADIKTNYLALKEKCKIYIHQQHEIECMWSILREEQKLIRK